MNQSVARETSMDVRSFVRDLPKAELHLHLEGSLEPELLMRLATRNRVEIPFRSVEEIRAAYDFSDLQDFLDIYYQGMNVLQTEEDFYDLTMAYLERAAADGTVHVEVFYDPQGHTTRGIPFPTVTDGILAALADGRDRFGITSLLILCILRHLSEEEGFATFREAEPYIAGGRLAGLGLDSTERGNPPGKFRRLFAAAREAGLELVAHAGEEGPAAYVADAVDLLGVDRIDHGNRALDDPALVRRLADRGIALTVCPLSNLRLGGVPEPRATSAEAHARCRAQGHRQLGRPGLFRRLPGGQLRRGRRGARTRPAGSGYPGAEFDRRIVHGRRRPNGRIWLGSARPWGAQGEPSLRRTFSGISRCRVPGGRGRAATTGGHDRRP